jgi:predicted HicB family RNase H-like nuclease
MEFRPPPLGTLKHGTQLTEELAEQLADEAERGYDLKEGRRVGRPSLGEGVSPRVNFRITQALHERALERAQREGKTVSQIAREALEKYVRR